MLRVKLLRTHLKGNVTLGALIVEDKLFCTLELPWKDNQSNISCIPHGEYFCEYLPASASGKYRKVYHVKGVPGRVGILIHNGNLVKHTKGCVILGMRHGKLGDEDAVLESTKAMRQLNSILNKRPFILEVTDGISD